MIQVSDIRKRRIFAAPENLAKRVTDEDISIFRSSFQRDRDRILYSKSFRRLDGKTQVFLTRSNDHIRNCLTHSLEVNQIARTSAKTLGLNSELVESIALGHDIGHTPFGHVGERTLNHIMNGCLKITMQGQQIIRGKRGFKHNHQGVRVFSDLHSIYPNLHGTNLTNFTLYGIAKHSKEEYGACKSLHNQLCYRKDKVACPNAGKLSVDFYDQYKQTLLIDGTDVEAWSFEARVVELADEIAQRHHDVEDAYQMNILTKEDIIGKIEECFGHILDSKDLKKLNDIKNTDSFFSSLISQFIVSLYNVNLIKSSKQALVKFSEDVDLKMRRDFKENYTAYDPKITTQLITFSKEFSKGDKCFQKFLGSTILNSHRAQRMDGKGSFIIEKLFKAYFTNPRQLHDSTILAAFNMYENTTYKMGQISKIRLGDYRNKVATAKMKSDPLFENALLRAICDHIAGMTDNFVIEEYSRLYGERPV